ncbi:MULTISPECIES: YoaK family protein [Mycobacterium]|uniref:DUF1275 domain-containing protein n=1 Tax=Mycobacterium kiyosense TaxID=2871094 RepID=A0A9P3Q5Z5_9MYCO|nr:MULTISPECIES: YoaK family protein [Mycobacterium]BDB44851.1 hypothetical protein IWGMT90018_52970 [Mycobacterium kiyosense]BDE16337.1 hypothetical protein MKCMC460_51970 [Mycobacterium sp. 20KCMC460]GLB82813.1 hypothetical protein SRL2020028_20690 [Mycobacterium kiyosense]GLB89448.1 hypothetical protein SRL2020130_22650 [Mycobacterium kiyosense]GLB94946.1 hypothetical protein SRL2020226_17220 [Mycobacterium kiyosense]
MPQPNPARADGHPPRAQMLAYSAVLALIAGFVNAVALLILAFPVGNLTAVTTQIGMNTANPWLYEGHMLAAILIGFLAGATMAGALLAPTDGITGRRHAVVLTLEAGLLLLAALGVEEPFVRTQIESFGVELAAAQAFFAATALGLQNALTSSFRGMAVRTTHFTGTVTDLGLMLGRSREHGIEKWKAAILSVTLLLFLVGAIAGLLIGARIGGYALVVPAAMCVAVAAANLLHSRGYRKEPQDRAAEVAVA